MTVNPKMRWFIFNWALYILALILTTVYAYARLDFVRTQPYSENVEKT